jgi:uncharacterized iron-regulated membrane protein
VTVRKVLFWTHLVAGVTAGVVIFIMSITGAALALQPQILLWAERDQRTVAPPSPDAQWLGPDALLGRVRDAQPTLVVTGLTLEHDRTLAAVVTLTKAEAPPAGAPPAPQTTLWVNPYTGAVVGQLDATTPWRRFFRVSTDWHRWLAMNGENRPIGRWITGVSNAAFLVLALTGMYIWLPRVWSRVAVRAVGWFRTGLSGKARDFNWHNVLGIWSAPVLVVLTFTGMCISFPKTYDVIYSITWMQRPPAPAGPQAQAGPGPQGPREGGQRPAPNGSGPREPSAETAARPIVLDAVWPVAESHLPTWRSIAMRLPQRAGQPVTFTINDRERINPMARSTLTVDPVNARVVRWEPYEQLASGQRLRTWMRFGHTGELWGITGQVIAGLASAAGCVLVWTGLALAWRRFMAWRTRRRREETVAIDKAA